MSWAGGKGKTADTQPKREAVFPAVGCVLDGGQGTEQFWSQLLSKAEWDMPCTVMLPTPMPSPVPSHCRCCHPGSVQETWVRSSPRADTILLRAPTEAPARPGLALTQHPVPGTSHGTCRKFRLRLCEGSGFDGLRRVKPL